jgi:hypothetical protein
VQRIFCGRSRFSVKSGSFEKNYGLELDLDLFLQTATATAVEWMLLIVRLYDTSGIAPSLRYGLTNSMFAS